MWYDKSEKITNYESIFLLRVKHLINRMFLLKLIIISLVIQNETFWTYITNSVVCNMRYGLRLEARYNSAQPVRVGTS